jgi:ribosomal protein L36
MSSYFDNVCLKQNRCNECASVKQENGVCVICSARRQERNIAADKLERYIRHNGGRHGVALKALADKIRNGEII